jgi:hypothetical protein
MDEKDIDQKSIRTYESDIANAIQHKSVSRVSMTMAEEEKRQENANVVVVAQTDDSKKGHGSLVKNIFIILLSLIILAAGIGATYYFYTISPLTVRQPSQPTTPTTVVISSIVTPDVQKTLDITGQNGSGLIGTIEKQIGSDSNSLTSGEILEFVFGIQSSTTLNRVTGPQFISLLGLNPPSSFTSSLTNQWMFGTYLPASGTVDINPAPFVILTTNFFQNAFAGMLKWEPTMGSDLAGLFGLQPSQWVGGTFHDIVIKNRDAREFVDNGGNPLFLYAFIDNSTLVIAQSESALNEIIGRFESRAYVR